MSARCDIRALSVGTRFYNCCHGRGFARVLSVHARVINVVCKDELLALALPQVGGSSRFLCLSALPDLVCGDIVQLTPQALIMETATIDLTEVSIWKGPLPVEIRATLTAANYALFEEAVRTLALKPGVDAACSLSPATVSRWMGLGPGLTPAGDDVLLGYLAVDNLFGRDKARTKALHKAVESALGQTTTLSAHILRSALCSDYHEYIQCVLAVISGLSNEHILTALRRLRAVGATSGESTIYGMLLAMQDIMLLDGVQESVEKQEVGVRS